MDSGRLVYARVYARPHFLLSDVLLLTAAFRPPSRVGFAGQERRLAGAHVGGLQAALPAFASHGLLTAAFRPPHNKEAGPALVGAPARRGVEGAVIYFPTFAVSSTW